MLADIGKIAPYFDKETQVQHVYLEVIGSLQSSEKLNFEYLGPNGDPLVSEAVFKSIFGALYSKEISAKTAKIHTSNGINGMYDFSYLISNYYLEGVTYYLPQADLGRYDIIKGYQNPIETYGKLAALDISKLKNDSILVINSSTLKEQACDEIFNNELIEQINSKNIFVVLDIDRLDFDSKGRVERDFNHLLGESAKNISNIFVRLNNVGLNFDTGKITYMPGLNFGNLFIKFPEGSDPHLFESTSAFQNRITLSTPIKLGLDIIKVLLEDNEYSRTVASLLDTHENK
jgi:hypothetical protein